MRKRTICILVCLLLVLLCATLAYLIHSYASVTNEAFAPLAGDWFLYSARLRGISIPAEALGLAKDTVLGIEANGNAYLGKGSFTLQPTEDGNFLLRPEGTDASPIILKPDHADWLYLSISDNTVLTFCSPRWRNRTMLNGEWQLTAFEIPALGLKQSISTDAMSMHITITEYDLVDFGEDPHSFVISGSFLLGYSYLMREAPPTCTVVLDESGETLSLTASDGNYILYFTHPVV